MQESLDTSILAFSTVDNISLEHKSILTELKNEIKRNQNGGIASECYLVYKDWKVLIVYLFFAIRGK